MPRYFLELAYKGNRYSGFQVQDNAMSIQEEVEKAMSIYFRRKMPLTGSSRTDAEVHAWQNFFHFDSPEPIDPKGLYNINAILPPDIVLRNLYPVAENAHCRFDAVSREYRYYIYRRKDPFLADRAYFFPYTLDRRWLDDAAAIIPRYEDFRSFSKRRTQVKHFLCQVYESDWTDEDGCLVYRVRANRFLRGMVRGLVATMLQVGRGRMGVADFEQVLIRKDNQQADFDVPGHGLFLFQVSYPVSVLSLPAATAGQ
jgi:tRNA pseudouridine38-40 synthase